MKPPLDGIKILDLTIWQNGPMATLMLAEMGAEVIKIEDTVMGDPSRGYQIKDPREYHGIVPLYEMNNLNKKSMTLNLKDSRGREVFYQLVKKADVVAQNFRVGVAEKLGVDYKTLVHHNPKIIVASATGYGRQGPDAGIGLTDIAGMARSGLMNLLRSRRMFYPGPFALADAVGAIMLAYGVVLAIIARERYSIGQDVEVSQLGSLLLLQAISLGAYLVQGEPPPLHRRETAPSPLYNIYRAGDGGWIAFADPQSDRHWPAFCEVLGLQDLLHDARFSTQEAQAENAQELIAIIDEAFLARPRDEWLKLFNEQDVYYTPVQTYDKVIVDPQVLANEYITEIQHSAGIPLKVIGIPSKLSETPGYIVSEAPAWGQHTEEILLAQGYTWEQIGELKTDGII